MKKIQEYIQFAIDNGFNGIKFPQKIKYIGSNIIIDKLQNKYNLIEIITSKPFIEAIANGLINRIIKIDGKFDFIQIEGGLCSDIKEIIEELIRYQAIAIRDNKLEEFITNLKI